MRRLSLVLGTLLALAIALPVSANTVDRYPLTFDFTFADFTCGFITLANVTINNEYEKDFYDLEGNLVKSLINGRQVATFSNPANGKSIVENVSSSGHIDYETNAFLVTGRSGINAQIYTGRFDVSTGTFTGHLSDEICQALA